MASDVLWRDAARGDWVGLVPAPAVNRGFSERGHYRFRVPPPALMFIDDAPVVAAFDSNELEWVPGFFAGEVTAEVVNPATGARHTYLMDVSPDPAKLGRDMFIRMLDDLWHEDPWLVMGSEPAQSLTGNAGAVRDPWLAFARLRRYVPGYLSALDPVRRSPRRRLRVARASVAPSAVRRVDRATATTLYRSSAVALFANTTTLPDATSFRFNVPVVEDTLDSSANRCLCALTRALLSRTRTLIAELAVSVAKEVESDTRTALEARWPLRRAQLETFAIQLTTALGRSPLRDVTRPEVTAAGLTAIAADPVYARAWGSGWRALRDGADGSVEQDRMWISPSWEIYERWCYVTLRKSLQKVSPDLQWTRDQTGRSWKLRGSGIEGEFLLQPTFLAGPAENRRMWSVSRQREPDILLKVLKNGATRFICFDAKYRTSRPNVLDAMESAHIYQDSLRIGSDRPVACFLLVPAGGGAPWLEVPEFQSVHRVGILTLSPGSDIAVPESVTALLAS